MKTTRGRSPFRFIDDYEFVDGKAKAKSNRARKPSKNQASVLWGNVADEAGRSETPKHLPRPDLQTLWFRLANDRLIPGLLKASPL